jgi:hypothetical protein
MSWADLAPFGPGRGIARVYLDGRLVARVSLLSRTAAVRRLVFTRAWPRSGTHTIRLVNEATRGRPRIDLDGFVIRREQLSISVLPVRRQGEQAGVAQARRNDQWRTR